MSEMAMLYNLVGENDTQMEKVNAVFDKYKEFLLRITKRTSTGSFCENSSVGKIVSNGGKHDYVA